MSRLTEKDTNSLKYRLDMSDMFATIGGEVYEKLRPLEDIEDELGIDLITLFKALKTNKIFIKADYDGESVMPCNCFSLGLNGFANYYFYCQYGLVNEEYAFYNLKDYGKTWALTKEELKK